MSLRIGVKYANLRDAVCISYDFGTINAMLLLTYKNI